MTKTITRVYDDFASAQNAVINLEAAGLSQNNISVLASDAEGWYKPNSASVDPKHDKDRDGHDDRAEGATAGGGIGAVAGTAVGILTGLGLLAIPGVGPIVAAGWLAVAATGAVAGGATGGIIGALVQSGTSKENAEIYAEALRRGGAVVTARVPDAEEPQYAALLDASAVDVTKRAAIYRNSGWKGFDPDAPAFNAEQARLEREIYRG